MPPALGELKGKVPNRRAPAPQRSPGLLAARRPRRPPPPDRPRLPTRVVTAGGAQVAPGPRKPTEPRDDLFYPSEAEGLPRTSGPGDHWAPPPQNTGCWVLGAHYRGGVDSLGVERKWWIVALDPDNGHAYGYRRDGRNAGWSTIDLAALAAERDPAGRPRVTRDRDWIPVSTRRWTTP